MTGLRLHPRTIEVALGAVVLAFLTVYTTWHALAMLRPIAASLILGVTLATVTYPLFQMVDRVRARILVPYPVHVRAVRIGTLAEAQAMFMEVLGTAPVRLWVAVARAALGLHAEMEAYRRKGMLRMLAVTTLYGAVLTVVAVPYALFMVAHHFGFSAMVARMWRWVLAWPFPVPIPEAWHWCQLLKQSRVSAFFTVTLVMVVLVLPLFAIVYQLSFEAVQLARAVLRPESPEFVAISGTVSATLVSIRSHVPDWIPVSIPTSFEDIPLVEYAGQSTSVVIQFILSVFRGVLDYVLGAVVVMFVLYYGYMYGPQFLRWVQHNLPLDDAIEEHLFRKFHGMAHALIVGSIVVGIGQGTVNGLLLLFLGVDGWFNLSLLMILLSIIPAIGANLVMVPVALVMIVNGQVVSAVLVLVVGITVGTIDGPIRAKIVGRHVDLHEGIILLASVVGMMVFGAIGFILGPNVWIMAKELAETVKRETHAYYKRMQRALETAAFRDKLRKAREMYMPHTNRPVRCDDAANPARRRGWGRNKRALSRMMQQ